MIILMKRSMEVAYLRSPRRTECRWLRWISRSLKMKKRPASRANQTCNFIMGTTKIIKKRTDLRRPLLQSGMPMVQISKELEMKTKEQTLRRCHTVKWDWLHSFSIITQTTKAIMDRASQWAWVRLTIKKSEMNKTLALVAKNVVQI